MYTLLIYLFSESIFFHFENLYQNSNFHLNYLLYKLDNLFSKRYSTSSNTFDFSGINWEYAIVGIAMQNSGGRVNRYIIRNQPENYLVYNISSDKVATIGVAVSSNKLTIFIHSSTYTVSFYFYDIVFCKFI